MTVSVNVELNSSDAGFPKCMDMDVEIVIQMNGGLPNMYSLAFLSHQSDVFHTSGMCDGRHGESRSCEFPSNFEAGLAISSPWT